MIETKDLKKLGFEKATVGDLSGAWYHKSTDTYVCFGNYDSRMAEAYDMINGDSAHWTDLAFDMVGNLESKVWEIQMGDDL